MSTGIRFVSLLLVVAGMGQAAWAALPGAVTQPAAEPVAQPAEADPAFRAAGLLLPEHIHPQARPFWDRHVAEADRIRAIHDARIDALGRMMRQVKRLPFRPNESLGEWLARRPAELPALTSLFAAARASDIRYWKDAPAVELTLSLETHTLWPVLLDWARRQGAPPADIARIEELLIDASSRTLRATGVGLAECSKRLPPDSRRLCQIARATPAWAFETLQVTGRGGVAPGRSGFGPQQAVRAAEVQARMDLRDHLLELSLGDGQLGELLADVPARQQWLSDYVAAAETVVPDGQPEDVRYVVLEADLTLVWRQAIHYLLKDTSNEVARSDAPGRNESTSPPSADRE